MSTNLETSPNPSRWSSAAARARRLLRDALRGKKGLLCVFALGLAAGYALSVDWTEAGASLVSGMDARPADPALAAEARRLGLDYETVAADPRRYDGKPVAWCVDFEQGTRRFYVAGRTGWTVAFSGHPETVTKWSWRGSRCQPVLAIVRPTEANAVGLDFAGFL